jgi:biotin synthase
MAVCCGGIVGMGETREDRVGFIHALATLPRHPESVPVNALVPVKGTVLGDMWGEEPPINDIEFVRTGRGRAHHNAEVDGPPVGWPREHVGIDAGAVLSSRGANSIFTGDRLLTTPNAGDDSDAALFRQAGA